MCCKRTSSCISNFTCNMYSHVRIKVHICISNSKHLYSDLSYSIKFNVQLNKYVRNHLLINVVTHYYTVETFNIWFCNIGHTIIVNISVWRAFSIYRTIFLCSFLNLKYVSYSMSSLINATTMSMFIMYSVY